MYRCNVLPGEPCFKHAVKKTRAGTEAPAKLARGRHHLYILGTALSSKIIQLDWLVPTVIDSLSYKAFYGPAIIMFYVTI